MLATLPVAGGFQVEHKEPQSSFSITDHVFIVWDFPRSNYVLGMGLNQTKEPQNHSFLFLQCVFVTCRGINKPLVGQLLSDRPEQSTAKPLSKFE